MKKIKIFGGPGCGKTTSLIKIIEESKIPLSKIAYCTYTTKALGEMTDRMIKKGADKSDLAFFKTMHSLNFTLLGIKKDAVVGDKLKNDKKMREFCKEKHFILSFSNKEDRTLDDEFYDQMNRDRNDLRDFTFVHPQFRSVATQYLHFKRSYFEWLEEHEYIDFIGMIEQGIARGVVPPVDLLCVDEWQDLSLLQVKQITLWATNIPTSYHAGDDDQCINTWAGAAQGAFLNFACGNEIVLKESFRLPSDILSLSQEIITKNRNRKEKDFYTNKEKGSIFMKSMYGASEFLKTTHPSDSCYILVRNRYLIGLVKNKLIEYGVPLSGFDIEKRAIQLMLEGFKNKKRTFSQNDLFILSDESIFPSARYFKKGIKKTFKNAQLGLFPSNGYTFKQMSDLGVKGQFFEDFITGNLSHLNIPVEISTYIQKMINQYTPDQREVTIMTIHEAKGLEADTVIIIPYMASKTAKESSIDHVSIEEERRVWYTAITRSKKNLICITDIFSGIPVSSITNAISVFLKR